MNTEDQERIEPRILKGFRDYPPELMLPRERIIETAKSVYRSFGFSPIETPVLEYFEILAGKGSEETDRQMYHFHDHGDRHVGMRFDLTVPLARFVAQHANEIGFPFKRYHIATVWRGESPQAGRYREFMQCDFDTIGTDSLAADVETALVIHELLTAIGFQRFEIRLNNRKILNGILDHVGLLPAATAVLRAVDKLGKLGPESVAAELRATAHASAEQSATILQMATLTGSTNEVLDRLEHLAAGDALALQGLSELRQVLTAAKSVGVPEDKLRVDPSIARGLDYYTGSIYETFLLDLPQIGSICSGGRYDDLARLFTRQHLPGIGASLGLDRLLAAMEQLQMLPQTRTPADVLIVQFLSTDLEVYLRLAAALRRSGLAVEVFPEAKKVGQQFKYADKRGHVAALLAGPDEIKAGRIQLKWMADGSQIELPLTPSAAEISAAIKSRLGNSPAGLS